MFKSLIIFLLLFINSCSSAETITNDNYVEAQVINVMSSLTIENKDMGIENQSARIVVKMLSGPDSDKEVIINQQLVPKINDIAIPDPGDVVVLSETVLNDGTSGLQIIDIRRSGIAFLAIFLLFLIMSVFGGVKGVVFSLLLISIFFSVNYILFPIISWGLSPIFFTFIGTNILSALIAFLIHSKEKVRSAIFSNFISLFIISIFSYIFSSYGAFGSILSRNSVSIVSQEINVGSLIASAILLSTSGLVINMNLLVFNNKENKGLLTRSDNNFSTLLNSVRPTAFIHVLFVSVIYMGLSLPILFSKSAVSSLRSMINTDIITFYMVAVSISGIGIISSAVISCFISQYLSSTETAKKMRNLKSTQDLKK